MTEEIDIFADPPSTAMAITSEFTSTAIRYIALLETVVEHTLVTGADYAAQRYPMALVDARRRFMNDTPGSPGLWFDLEHQCRVYKNLLRVMAEEIRKWEAESGS